jgi:hypothetical protein
LLGTNQMKTIHFERFFTPKIVQCISNDEEIAADAFGLIILHLETISMKDDVVMYSPRLLFLLLSLFDESELLPRPKDHPPNRTRLSLVKEMTAALNSSLNFDSVDECIVELWNQGRDRIRKRVDKEKKALQKSIQRFLDIQDKMVARGYPKIIDAN